MRVNPNKYDVPSFRGLPTRKQAVFIDLDTLHVAPICATQISCKIMRSHETLIDLDMLRVPTICASQMSHTVMRSDGTSIDLDTLHVATIYAARGVMKLACRRSNNYKTLHVTG
jgi:hypothetical protein